MKTKDYLLVALAAGAGYLIYKQMTSYDAGFDSESIGWTQGLGAALASPNPQAETAKYINSTPELQATGKALSKMKKVSIAGKVYRGKVQDLGPSGVKFVGIRKPDTDAAGKTAMDRQIEKNKANAVKKGINKSNYKRY